MQKNELSDEVVSWNSVMLYKQEMELSLEGLMFIQSYWTQTS